jgi:serine/threonine protein kinase
VWLAPEVIRQETYTEKADVYSFAVICYELLTKKQYFHDTGFFAQIEEKVKAGRRPSLPPQQTMPEFVQLIQNCWANEASRRPYMAAVVVTLEEMMAKYFPEAWAKSNAPAATEDST